MGSVGFVTEASPQIGYGHLYRSIALAQKFELNGFGVIFFVNNPSLEKLVVKQVPSAQIIVTDALKGLANVGEEHPEFLIIDVFHQNLSMYRFLERMDDPVMVVVIDDMFSDYALNAEFVFKIGFQGYKRKEVVCELENGRFMRQFSGTDFIMLRSEFGKSFEYECRHDVDKVLVTMGGSDPWFLTELAVDALRLIHKPLQITHVFGAAFTEERIGKIKTAYEGSRHSITCQQSVCNMDGIMVANDIALINGGSTRFELATIGVPFLSISFNEKQNMISENISKEGVGRHLGIFSKQSPSCLRAAIMEFADDYPLRKSMSRRMRSAMPQSGANNVFTEITSLDVG